jgi:hypothetical protein
MTKEIKKRKQGERGKDKKKRIRGKIPVHYENIEYWEEMLVTVEKRLMNYYNSAKVQKYVNRKLKPLENTLPALTPLELIERGVDYFRFILKHKKSMTLHGLAIHLGIGIETLMRMQQQEGRDNVYVTDVYVPIVKTLKNLIGLFHEEMGNYKMNPNFHIFLLKVMRNGFEEQVDLNLNNEPQGLPEAERIKLREKVRGFSEGRIAEKSSFKKID